MVGGNVHKSRIFILYRPEGVKKAADYVGMLLAQGHSVDCKTIGYQVVKVDSYSYDWERPFGNIDGIDG